MILETDQDVAGPRNGRETESPKVPRYKGGQEDTGLPGSDQQAVTEGHQAPL